MTAYLLSLIALPAIAAEKSGRLAVDIKVEGTQSWHAARDHGRARITERYRLLIPLRSDGVPSSVNAVAPNHSLTQIGRAVQAQREAMKRQGIAVTPFPTTPEVAMARQEALAAETRQQQAACGEEMACLTRLASVTRRNPPPFPIRVRPPPATMMRSARSTAVIRSAAPRSISASTTCRRVPMPTSAA